MFWSYLEIKTAHKSIITVIIACELYREGATPIRFGPRPLNNALAPSVSTMCLQKQKKLLKQCAYVHYF